MSVLLPPLWLAMPKARAAGGLCAEGAGDEMLCRMWRNSTMLCPTLDISVISTKTKLAGSKLGGHNVRGNRWALSTGGH